MVVMVAIILVAMVAVVMVVVVGIVVVGLAIRVILAVVAVGALFWATDELPS